MGSKCDQQAKKLNAANAGGCGSAWQTSLCVFLSARSASLVSCIMLNVNPPAQTQSPSPPGPAALSTKIKAHGRDIPDDYFPFCRRKPCFYLLVPLKTLYYLLLFVVLITSHNRRNNGHKKKIFSTKTILLKHYFPLSFPKLNICQ